MTGPSTSPCPKCGYPVEAGSPICGNCGTPLGGYATHTSLAAAGTGRRKFIAVMVALFALGGVAWWASPTVRAFMDNFESLDSSSSDFEVSGDPAVVDVEDFGIRSPYHGVRELVAALNKGGLDCTRVKIDHADEYVATGSCQAPGEFIRTHVQINIYFTPETLDAAEGIFRERAFTTVHDANWFVISDLPTARRVHKILGGRLVPARDA